MPAHVARQTAAVANLQAQGHADCGRPAGDQAAFTCCGASAGIAGHSRPKFQQDEDHFLCRIRTDFQPASRRAYPQELHSGCGALLFAAGAALHQPGMVPFIIHDTLVHSIRDFCVHSCRGLGCGALLLLQLERPCASLAWNPGRGCQVAVTAPGSNNQLHVYDLEVTQARTSISCPPVLSRLPCVTCPLPFLSFTLLRHLLLPLPTVPCFLAPPPLFAVLSLSLSVIQPVPELQMAACTCPAALATWSQ